ncbi:2-keto-4-pentenoate hydratase/2-oxohepta-3-ene-1,7-dioic acid hydratase (catechol pathway) [Streptomyces zhaozhouensis]|uniref:2-keto-4-pentenoate hydratase/2-oxohepta-3-ene-1,7-dioic acid hydratase (Catechol pathway) n=1 Tax=Streptomyces zhaozhouensis TaxID=1300267 RepID=A0A286DSV9_9ACTN|nr:fumarylacetoacetate hydrolase family protein [Streptomyces zhaozhouensis]SOD61725.1 2-keto-4-pentenoate hydratase/2-oxohepta-3-ene-1,7-dioic acid hydratase (catechol pathway) [Streptomyces zhaozhouensis]
MKLALFDDHRLGVVDETGETPLVVDVTDALGWEHDPDPVTAGWWRRLCRDFAGARGRLAEAAARGTGRPLAEVRLRAPALNPSKIVACACNYADHVAEMHEVQERTLGGVESWMMNFDVFLKSPSSLSGPAEDIVLPTEVVEAGQEIHHESELVIVVGTGGSDIPRERALEHVLGYTLGLDITVRSAADRSRRKSYDTFSPLGPFLTTADEVGDAGGLGIRLDVNGGERQRVNTADLLTPVPDIVSYASHMMTLLPGDLIFTGAPPGVGAIVPGDRVRASIDGVGTLDLAVRRG